MASLGLALVLAVFGAQAGWAQSPRMTGDWGGTYSCAQGKTGVTLSIQEQNGPNFTGVFHFYAVKENPQVPEGCFQVSGQTSPGGRVEITGRNWLKRPAGYVAVNLAGQLTSDARRLLGVVILPGYQGLCTNFLVAKTAETPRIPDACRTEAPAISLLQ